jgi:hypothetical protein
MAEWYEQLLDRQLRVNRDIWAQLEEHGIDDESRLRLGFLYAAPGEPEAKRLAEFLRAETDYEVDARARRAGLRPKAAWFVIGTTQPTAVSLPLLDEWVEWMIAAGAAEGPCAFDGWAAQLVDD